MDEPTTGLHLEDVRKLAEVLDRLVEAGHTVLLIEHNLDVIKLADWIIDVGPGGGDGGGTIVAMGTPEEVAATPPRHRTLPAGGPGGGYAGAGEPIIQAAARDGARPSEGSGGRQGIPRVGGAHRTRRPPPH
ncbi:MAG: hypothetical protein IPK33_00710 [Gemmatimonadetes bacterium]|nr:hypothetical protein [Gemmatimonadota bacterium]